MTVDAAQIANTLKSSLGHISVRARRPGVYQIQVPAALGDSDGALVFVREAKSERLVVTDLGHTLMRASYSQPLSPRMTDAVERLAKRNGFELIEGEVRATVPWSEFLVAVLGLVQIQAQAEVAILAPVPRERSEAFKSKVVEAIRTALDDCEVNFTDRAVDPEGLFPIDLVVRGRRWANVAIVANDNDASSATMAKLKHAQSPALNPHRPFWAVIPRDIEALSQLNRRRVISEFLVLTAAWGGGSLEEVTARLRDLAEPKGGLPGLPSGQDRLTPEFRPPAAEGEPTSVQRTGSERT